MDNDGFMDYHFFCRLLNTAYNSALLENADKTADIIPYISDIARYALRYDKKIVTLDDEINVLEKYIYIEAANGMNIGLERGSGAEEFKTVFIPHLGILKDFMSKIGEITDRYREKGKLSIAVYIDNDCIKITGSAPNEEAIEEIVARRL